MKRDFAIGCIYIALATMIFSTMEVMLKLPVVAGVFHPMQITVERFLVGGLCLLPLAIRTLKRRGLTCGRGEVAYFSLTGLLCVPLSMVLYQLSITYGRASAVAVLFSGNPIFVTLLAFLLLHEAIYWNNLLALVFELAGILVIVWPTGGNPLSPVSVVLALLSAVLFALYSVLGKRKTQTYGSLVVTCASFLFGGGELLLLLLLGHLPPVAALFRGMGLSIFCQVPFFSGIRLDTLPYFLFICVVNSAAGYVCHMMAIEKTSATYGSLVFFFKPIFAPLLALLALGEAITSQMTLGIVLFLCGSLLGIFSALHRSRQPRTPTT